MAIGAFHQLYVYAICWDFDETILLGHSHHALALAGVKSGEGAQHIDALFTGKTIGDSHYSLIPVGLKTPEEVSVLMKRALNNGIGIAIVSFNKYPEIIKPFLLQLTQYADQGGLTPDDVEKIFVRAGFPSDDNVRNSLMGKKEHLADVMAHFGIHDKNKVLLVDDSRRNCLICRGQNPGDCESIDPDAVGFHAVMVPKHPDESLEYIDEIEKFIDQVVQSHYFVPLMPLTSKP